MGLFTAAILALVRSDLFVCFTLNQYHEIRMGMSERQVRALVGEAPGDYSTCEPVISMESKSFIWCESPNAPRDTTGEWRSDAGALLVFFKGGQVVGKMYTLYCPEHTFLTRFRCWSTCSRKP